MKNKIIFFTFFLISALGQTAIAQSIVPIYENTIALRIFDDGLMKQIEYQEVSKIEVGNELITYFDTRENFCVFANGKKTDLHPAVNQFKLSETSVVYNSGPITFMYKDGKKSVLTNYGRAFDVADSMAVFVNTFDNAVYARYNGENVLMYSAIGDIQNLGLLGENTFVFKNNASDYVLFHRGQFTTLINSQYNLNVQVGLDMVAFNDPFNGTFAVYDDGEVLDVEDFQVKNYKVGHNFVAYEDANGNLKVYEDGETNEIATFPDFYEVKDSLIVFAEGGALKAHYKGETHYLENFVPQVRVMKNGILAYKDQNNAVVGFINGEKKKLTNEFVSEIAINGNAVYFKNQQERTLVYWKGKIYN